MDSIINELLYISFLQRMALKKLMEKANGGLTIRPVSDCKFLKICKNKTSKNRGKRNA